MSSLKQAKKCSNFRDRDGVCCMPPLTYLGMNSTDATGCVF